MNGSLLPRFVSMCRLQCPALGRFLLLAVGLLLVGCSTPRSGSAATGESDPLAGIPRDFQLDVRVLVGRNVDDRDRLERRASHIVLLPDGSLHAVVGSDVVPGSRPGLSRVLYRDQVADVWALLGRLGIIGEGEPVTGPVRVPGAKEIVYVVEYTMNNDRRRIVQRVLSPEARESANTVLVRTLGALAWLRDAPLQDSTVEPLRYDFGPDPWARYRTVEGDG